MEKTTLDPRVLSIVLEMARKGPKTGGYLRV
jgi:hypothetical protein